MNSTTSRRAETIEAISTWFSDAIESLDQFGEYDQLQLIICAHEINFEHSRISKKVKEIATREDVLSIDYVFQFLEQLVLMKYKAGKTRQQKFFDFWIQEKNYETQSIVTQAYLFGYLAMEENTLPSPELKQEAINWLKETAFLPSISFTAWVAFYLDKNNEPEAANIRFEELMGLREDNGSWNNVPLRTIQTAYPLSLTSFGSNESLTVTSEFILSQPWKTYSGNISYETGLIKWLNANKYI